MTARWATALGSVAATAVVLALAAAGGSETTVATEAARLTTDRVEIKGSEQKVAVEKCSTRSQADFPGAFTNRRNLVVGPLAMMGAGKDRVYFFPDFASDAGGQKFQLLVRNGHRVTLELSRRTRQGAGLAYGRLPGDRSLADTHRVVKFIACRRGVSSGSSADGQPVTFWSGGVAASSPRCVPLRVFVDGASAARRAVIHLGVRRCQ